MKISSRERVRAGGRAAAAALGAAAACLGVGAALEWLGTSPSHEASNAAAPACVDAPAAPAPAAAVVQYVPASGSRSTRPAAGVVPDAHWATASLAPARGESISPAGPPRPPARATRRPAKQGTASKPATAHEPAALAPTSPGAVERPRSGAKRRAARRAPLAAAPAKTAEPADLDTAVKLSTAGDWRRAAAKVSQSAQAPIEAPSFVPSGDDWTECSDVYVYIVSLDIESPHESMASLALSKTEPGRWRQPGQSLGGWEVLAILDDWSGLNPAVWLRRGEAVCRAELAGNSIRRVKEAPPRRKRTRRRR